MIVWQNDRIGVSNLEPHIAKGTPFKERWRLLSRSPMAGVHWGLIAANAVIISGSSILAGSIDKSSEDGQQKENSAKALRGFRRPLMLDPGGC